MDMDEEATGMEEDYYGLLNVSRQATTEDIKAAYRRLCIIYHPDKHHTTAERELATVMFARVQRASEVLTDEKLRAVYDIYGQSGLEAGLDVAVSSTSPTEIREEYERLKKQREEEKILRRTNQNAALTIEVNGEGLFDPTLRAYGDLLSGFEVTRLNMQQSVMAPIGTNNSVVVQAMLETANGNGGGTMSVSGRRDIGSNAWVEADVGVGDGKQYYGTVKVFTSISQYMYGTISATLQGRHASAPQPSAVVTLGRQLDTETMGQLTWKCGMENNMSVSLVRRAALSSGMLALQIGDPGLVAFSTAYRVSEKLKLKAAVQVGTREGSIEYGADRKVSRHNKVGLSVSLGLVNGVVVKFKFARAKQSITVPVLVTDTVSLSSAMWATLLPFGVMWTATRYVLEPYQAREERRRVQKLRETRVDLLKLKRREAEMCVRLMKEQVAKRVEAEELKRGLVIVRAWYGNLSAGVTDSQSDDELGPRVIDVTVPLQALVRESQLHLFENTKSGLPGFYDCAVGEEKTLRVQYRFRGSLHEVAVGDDEPLAIPKRVDAVRSTS